VRERVFEDYRTRYPGMDDAGLRVEMRKEMRAKIVAKRQQSGLGIEFSLNVPWMFTGCSLNVP
jgi:hypothetical protein